MSLPVKKAAKSLQASVDRNSEATGIGGFVNLSTVANNERALLLFLVIVSKEKNKGPSCIFQSQIL